MTIFAEFYRLDPFEEARGPLEDLREHDGSLVAKIGKVQIILPQILDQSLRPLIGRSIAILRTDNPLRPFLFRDLTSESARTENTN